MRHLFFRLPLSSHRAELRFGTPLILSCIAISAAILGEYYAACFIFYGLEQAMGMAKLTSYLVTAGLLLLQSIMFFWFCSLYVRRNRNGLLLKKLFMAFVDGFYSK